MSWEDILKDAGYNSEIRRLDEAWRRIQLRLDAIVRVAESTIEGLGDTDESIGLSEDELEKRMMEIIEIATGKK